MKEQTLTMKRTKKALKRKNKKYTGPKYSHLEMMLMWAPLLGKAGINMYETAPQEQPIYKDQPNDNTTTFV